MLPNLPYAFIALIATKLGQAWRLAEGADASAKLLGSLTQGLGEAFSSPLPSFHPVDLLVGVVIAGIIRLVVYVKGKNAKKFRKNMEYGSARWGTAEDIAPYADPKFENNVILTQTERLMMSNRPKDPKTARNKNVMIIGGSGSGKTRFWLKPNLMQCHSSYVVTDPKGSIAVECGRLMLRNGYKVKIFNKRCVIIEEISNGGLNPHTGDYFISSSKQYYCGSDAQEQVLLPCTYLGRIGDLCDSIIEVGGDYTSSIGICSKKQQNLFVNNGSPSIALSQLEVLA